MSTSTAPHDLAAIKHALELGLILAALVLAAAAHGDTRLVPDLMAAAGYFLPVQATDLGPKRQPCSHSLLPSSASTNKRLPLALRLL
jgi:hypothetical protein